MFNQLVRFIRRNWQASKDPDLASHLLLQVLLGLGLVVVDHKLIRLKMAEAALSQDQPTMPTTFY